MTKARDPSMDLDAIRGYIDETPTRAATGDPDDLIHVAKHVLGIPAVRRNPFEKERTTIL